MAETWVINENAKIYNIYGKYNILFTSNNENFTAMNFVDLGTPRDPLFYLIYYKNNQQINAAENDTEDEFGTYWFNQAYRTVTFDEPPTGNLLTWLQANAVKQQSKVSVDLTTLSGWDDVTEGEHSLQIVAKASGYRNSYPSQAVTVTKEAPQPQQYEITITNQTDIDFPSFNLFGLTKVSGDDSLAVGQTTTLILEKVVGYNEYLIGCRGFSFFVDSGSTFDGVVDNVVGNGSLANIVLSSDYGIGSAVIRGYDD